MKNLLKKEFVQDGIIKPEVKAGDMASGSKKTSGVAQTACGNLSFAERGKR